MSRAPTSGQHRARHSDTSPRSMAPTNARATSSPCAGWACRLVVGYGFRPYETQPLPRSRFTPKAHNSSSSKNRRMVAKQRLWRPQDPEHRLRRDRAGHWTGLGYVVQGHQGRIPTKMEQMTGECIDLHVTYPAFVLGCTFLVRGNSKTTHDERLARSLDHNDIAQPTDGCQLSQLRTTTGP